MAVLSTANVTVMTAAAWLLLVPGSSSAAPAAQPARPPSAVSAPTVAVAVQPAPRAARPAAKPKRVAPHRGTPTPSRRTAQVPRPKARTRPVTARPAPAARRLSASSWSWSEEFEAAVHHIPGYNPGDARWVVTSSYGSWGTADWYRGVVYISPRVPRARLYDVAVHEWSHLLSVRPYAGDVDEAVRAMNSYFGGSGLVGAERAADCMARLLGAEWTNYTPCGNASWRAGAARLVNGARL